MKFLLLFVGLFCCIAGLFLKQDIIRKTEGKVCIISGVLFILVNFIFLLFNIGTHIIFVTAILAIVGISGAGKFNNYRMRFRKLTDKQNNTLKWGCYFFIMFVIGCFMIGTALVPDVTLDNEKIHMGGMFGGDYYISDVQSVDTVRVYPRIGFMRGGSGFPGINVGNFDVPNEKMPAKYCIYRNNPPYIKIRMNDNRVFLLNFKKPDKTVAFYNQLQNELITD